MADVSKSREKKARLAPALLIVFIIAWSATHSFLGIDMVDTGAYFYSYLHPLSDYISYSTYLGTLIGAAWFRLFPSLGLWGLNLLELLLEYTLCILVYLTFRKTYRKTSLLVAITFCMLAISTYVNAFNYHQLGMFCCTAMLCFMYTGLKNDRAAWQIGAGAMAALSVFSRFPCILSLLCILCILYWRILVRGSFRRALGEIVLFLLGFAAMAGAFVFTLHNLGVLDRVVNDVSRISNLGGAGTKTYNVNNLSINLVIDTFHSVEAVLLFAIGCCIISIGIVFFASTMKSGRSKRRTRMVSLITLLVSLCCGILDAYYAIYYVGRAPDFIQLTSFSWFLYGILFLSGAAFSLWGIVLACSGRASKKDAEATELSRDMLKKREDAAIGFMGIALVLLCFVGSAARSKHAILGMWFLAPLLVDRAADLREKARRDKSGAHPAFRCLVSSLCAGVILFSCAFGWFVVRTNNFDDPDLTMLTETIDSPRTVFLKTSKRQADAVNEVLAVLSPFAEQRKTLLVIGNSVLFYALSDMPSYVRPWVTGSSYLFAELKSDFSKMKSALPPVVIYSKTNPYLGFRSDDYEQQLKEIDAQNSTSPRVEYIREYMADHSYTLLFENDYFQVLVPEIYV